MDFKLKRTHSISTLRNYMGRVIVVSNRLPVSSSFNEEEKKWTFKMSSGGLVAGLEGVKKKLPFLWVGWTGCNIPQDQRESFSDELMKQHRCIPVHLEDKLAEDFYNGFSNGVLWPLFHYMLEESGSNFTEALWKSYQEANLKFAEVVASIWQPGDLIWIHDYHLMKLPEYLRQRLPKARMGFFLHIPFPTSEIFQVLPVRKKILQGLVNCDLIGFHTYDYARHFIMSCARLLNLETNTAGVFYEGKYIPTIISPVGIDVDKFLNQLQDEQTKQMLEEYQKSFAGKKVLLAVDRLDYIKGIPNRLKAFHLFLQNHPEWRGKVVFIQVAVPSREDVEEYKRLKVEVETLVGHINGDFGDLNFQPIHYLFKSTPFPQLCALYRLSDVVLVTSIRDGMNLVAQEYIACQKDKHGILILSEFAGSANSLSGAVIVNPWDTHAVAQSIYESITMSEKEKLNRFTALYRYICTHTASRWGEMFIKELDRVSRAADELDKTPRATIDTIAPAYHTTKKRLLVFSSDGALIPYAALPFLASPSRRLTEALKKLCSDPLNKVYILSGRDRATLAQWFGSLPVSLVAEHGFFSCENAQNPQWNKEITDSDLNWKSRIIPILQHFTERTPGSFFEEKETSVTWHFRSTDQNFGLFRANELYEVLDNITFPAQVIMNEKSVEVRPFDCNFTTILKKILKKHDDSDFVLLIGEASNIDFSDDPKVYDCGVGKKNQKFYLNDTNDVLRLLEQLAVPLSEQQQQQSTSTTQQTTGNHLQNPLPSSSVARPSMHSVFKRSSGSIKPLYQQESELIQQLGATHVLGGTRTDTAPYQQVSSK